MIILATATPAFTQAASIAVVVLVMVVAGLRIGRLEWRQKHDRNERERWSRRGRHSHDRG